MLIQYFGECDILTAIFARGIAFPFELPRKHHKYHCEIKFSSIKRDCEGGAIRMLFMALERYYIYVML